MNARPVASGSAGSGLADPHPNEVKDAAKDRRAAVAEDYCVDAGRPKGRHTQARHRRVAGWRPDEGRKVGKLSIRTSQFHQIPIKYAVFDDNPIKSALTARSY